MEALSRQQSAFSQRSARKGGVPEVQELLQSIKRSREGVSMTVRRVAILGGALAVCVLGYTVHFVRNIDKSKAEHFAISNNPHTVADLVLAHIKRTGEPPHSVQECIVPSAEQPSEAMAKYGQVSIDTPYGGDIVVKSVIDRMVIKFPASPDGLALRDGVLVSTADGREVRLLDMIGRRDDAALRRANAYLWEKWRLLASGQPTGLAWLDALAPCTTTPAGQ